MTSSAKLSEALLQAVDAAFLVLGEIVGTAIYKCLGRRYQLKREEIPEKVDTFHSALQDMLGAGSEVMENLIAESFCSRLGLDFSRHDGWTLVDYVNHAKETNMHG